VTAAGLQYGKFVTASFDGQLLDRSNGGARPAAVKEALLIQYAGVYALPPSVPAVGKADAPAGEQLAYRISRPSTVTAVVTGPDGISHPIDAGARDPGTYRFAFTGLEQEGTWDWNVQATDDSNRQSTADQTFVYDATLSDLVVPKTASASSGLKVSFSLSRAASVTLAITAPNGTLVGSTAPAQLDAGPQSLGWDGTTSSGATAPPGTYIATVTETSSIGTVPSHSSFRLGR
jgi:flagellar hook capping protein FlgD